LANKAGSFVGDSMSTNSHKAVDATIEGMRAFQYKAKQTANVDFAQAKGNLFEYIETSKFNRNAAYAGSKLKAYTTDYNGDPHAAADILIKNGGKTVREVQAKVSDSTKNGKPNAAADSVFYQAGGQKGHWGKYKGMQRLIHKDENYNAEGSLLDEAKKIAGKRGDSQGIHAQDYKDVQKNLTDELSHGDISSGGTTMEELKEAYNDHEKYARRVERQELAHDMKVSAVNMAKAGAVSSGVASGISNLFQVYQDEKSLEEALKDVGVEAAKGGIRGGATGALSSAIRYGGAKTGIQILSDSTAATIMAGGMIDGGVALYSYARGEITAEELQKELVDTTAKAVTTVYFTKAVGMVFATANPSVPMAIYTAASYVVTSTRSIIENAQLNAEEYDRLAAMYRESTQMMEAYRARLNAQMASYELQQRNAMQSLLTNFEYNLATGEDYNQAIQSIMRFADETGLALQHTDFNDFKKAMKSDMDFTLKRK